MAYVPVPKDLSKIKTKLAFNLTKRQLICFSAAAVIGLPAYLFTREHIGNSGILRTYSVWCTCSKRTGNGRSLLWFTETKGCCLYA